MIPAAIARTGRGRGDGAIPYVAMMDGWLTEASHMAVQRHWMAAFGFGAAVGLEIWRCFVRSGMPARDMAERIGKPEIWVWHKLRPGVINGNTGLRILGELAYAMDAEPHFRITDREPA